MVKYSYIITYAHTPELITLSTAYKAFCTQLTKAFMAETSRNHCY